ncbi:hypothetical protein GUJ93_ZPchr0013g34312 [Zizania palustris]|uniref:Uncharacterized protein n=1 Tax=Zizania palustris TaxID=103762 RepID=A0A8J5X094_ZIZPA|nr:hypothetical protein GUJ93_ZPchr0013g34312 [Zizania palustris]
MLCGCAAASNAMRTKVAMGPTSWDKAVVVAAFWCCCLCLERQTQPQPAENKLARGARRNCTSCVRRLQLLGTSAVPFAVAVSTLPYARCHAALRRLPPHLDCPRQETKNTQKEFR